MKSCAKATSRSLASPTLLRRMSQSLRHAKERGIPDISPRFVSGVGECPSRLRTVLTPDMIAESALGLALPPPKGVELPPLGKTGGVLTPSTGLGMVLIERLKQSEKVFWDAKIYNTGKRIAT